VNSDVSEDFGMIVNDGMLSGLPLDRRLNSIYWWEHWIVLWACLL